MERFTNNAQSILAAPISDVDLSLTLAVGDGSDWPTLGAGEWCHSTISDGVNREIVQVTARVGDVLTIVRAQQGTTAASWPAGTPVELRLTAASLDRIPAPDEKAALAGTSGTPAAANRYVTDADARLSDTRTPTAHAASHASAGSDPLDHGTLAGLGDDDHSQYLLADGTRQLTGNLAVAAAVTIDGRDVSVDGSALDAHIGAANPHSGSVPTSRTVSTTAPLAGGGSLAGDLTISIPAATSVAPGHATAAQILKLDGIETGATADQNASEVPFTPNGDIAATNVQNAIVEVRDDTDTKLSSKADSSALTTHTGLTSGAHGISVYGASLIDDIDAATARGTLGLGTAATQASSAFEPSGAVASHAALTTTHGVTGAIVGTTDTQTLSGKTIAAGSNTITGIANGNIDAAAAIALSKLATVTASRALVSDAGGLITASAATATELGHLSGVTSGIQAQLNAKIGTALASANLLVGNASNVAAAVPVTGDISITNAGVTAIASGVIVNADVNAAAAIALSKLAPATASRLLVSDASGFITASAVTSTEAGYLSGVTSGIQAQLGDRVVGPASATDNAIARFDATTGKLVQNSTAILEDSGNLRLGGAPDSARLTIRGVGTTSATTGLIVENSAGTSLLRVGDSGIASFDTTLAITSATEAWSFVASGTPRSFIRANGAQSWFLSNGTSEIGSIVYAAPSPGVPGIAFFDQNNLLRSQFKLLGTTGGFAFASHAAGSPPTDRVFIKDSGLSIGVNSSAARLVTRGAGATSATTALLAENSAGTANLTVRDDGRVIVGENTVLTTAGGFVLNYAGKTPIAGGIYFNRVGNEPFFAWARDGVDQHQMRGLTDGMRWTDANGSVEYMRLASGALSLGTTTSPGRLTVRGAGTTSATTALHVENSAGTSLLTVRDDGGYAFRNGTVGVAQTGYATFTNLATLRTCDTSTVTLQQLAQLVGTMVEDLKTKGLIAA